MNRQDLLKVIRPIAPFKKAPIFILVAFCLMMQSLSTDLYVASLPSLGKAFEVSPSVVQLTLSVFMVAFGFSQLIAGPLSDRFGRRPVLVLGLSLYVLASAACALSFSIWLLIAARFFQALGCCASLIVARAIIRDAYAPEHGMQVMVRASSWLSVTPMLVPIIGAYLEVWFGWRGSFVLHTILSASLATAIYLFLPETNTHKNPDATKLSGLLISYKEVLSARPFWAYMVVGVFSYLLMFSFISGASMVLIRALDMPVAWFGYCFAFGTSGYMVGTLICRRLLHKVGTVPTLRIGTGIALLTGILFLGSVALGIIHWAVVALAMFLTFMTHGINAPISQAGSVAPFPKQAGTAAGLSGAFYMISAAGIGTIVGATYNGSLYPMAILACVNGALMFVVIRLFPDFKKTKSS